MSDNAAKNLADEYLRLGGKRQLVMDDNNLTTRTWQEESPDADTFWVQNIHSLPDDQRREVLSFLPSINAT